jgi:hypothetical protein
MADAQDEEKRACCTSSTTSATRCCRSWRGWTRRRGSGRSVVPSGWTPAGLAGHLGDAPPQYQQGPPQYQQAPPPAAPAAAPSVYDQLSQLATLHDQGALTDDEFTAAKAKLLGT